MSDRVGAMFARTRAEGRPAVIVFTPCGYPERDASYEIITAALAGGADAIEIGVPFSDPLGDGPVVQLANDEARRAGFTPPDLWPLLRRLRADGVSAPLLLMGYCNPLFAYGVEAFVQDAAAAGADGLIVVDLPPEEAGEVEAAARQARLHVIYLLAPTSTEERIELVSKHASGFIYCVSVTGVTGARATLSEQLPGFMARVRARTALPLAIGFGISSRAQVREVGGLADAAVIGSAFVNVITDAPREQRAARVRAYVEEITGRATD